VVAVLLVVGPAVAAADQNKQSNKAKPATVGDKTSEKVEPEKAEPEKESQAEAEKSPTDLRFYWNNGLRFETSDKAYSFRFGGRIQNDWAFPGDASDLEQIIGVVKGGTEFRRARLYIQGTLYGRVQFKAQYDFAPALTQFKDVYIGITKLPYLGTFRVGHFKEPFSLEELTSSKYITFMERSLPSIFWPSRNTGFMVFNNAMDQRLTWAVGAFLNAGGRGAAVATEDFNFTGRLTGLPWYKDGTHLFHVGGAASFRTPPKTRFSVRPEVHLLAKILDTKEIDVDSSTHLGLEASWVHGPFSAQAEYSAARLDAPESGDPNFYGYYIQASYFLTGESRAYSRSSGAFSRVKVKQNVGSDGGKGAWEVAVRHSKLDLSDEGISGGELKNVTVGLNWHLNPITRFMFNYVWTDVSKVGNASFFMMRFQVDF
jgi:phosphate-selective porin OprO/OprP